MAIVLRQSKREIRPAGRNLRTPRDGNSLHLSPMSPVKHPARLPKGAGILVRILPVTLAAIVCAGFALRLTIRDRFPPLAPLFYATPLPVLSVLASVAGGIWLARGKTIRGGAFFLASSLFALAWPPSAFLRNVPGAPSNDTRQIRVLFWNVFLGNLGRDGIARVVQERNPGVVGFVEAAGPEEDGVADWRGLFPGYDIEGERGGLVLLSRTRLSRRGGGNLDGGGRYLLAEAAPTSTGGVPLALLLADLPSLPPWGRRRPLDALRSIAERHAQGPILVMGDFNTPIESAYFDPWRVRFVHAFERRGHGFSPTWPFPLPLLEIDHIWAGGGIQLLRCEHLNSFRSDHRAVVVDVE